MKLIFPYSYWLIPLCFLLGAAYAFLLYRRDKRLTEFPEALIYILGGIRFVAATILAILLLSPLVKYISRQVSEPILIIAQDNSKSMVLNTDSSYNITELNEQLDLFKRKASSAFEIEHYLFGEELRKADTAASYKDMYTNFESLFKELKLRFENRNVGAIVLLSDGIFNQGLNPLYSAKATKYPIYTIARGDTTQRKDLLISNVISNKISFLGNQFPIRVEYKANMAKGNKVDIQLIHKGKKVDSKEVEITEQSQFGTVDFMPTSEASGLQTYQVRITELENESSRMNNSQNVYVEVLDSRQKILLLYQNPHPDIAAIQNAINSAENYQVEVKSIDQWDKELRSYDLAILHGIINTKNNVYPDLLKQLEENKVPLLYVAHQSTLWSELSKFSLPIIAKSASQGLNDIYPLYESAFPLFKLSEEQEKALGSYPPLKVPQGNFASNDQAYVLLKQQIGSVPTELPLLAFSQEDTYKKGILMGEGFWRWRIANYANYGNHKLFDQLISKIVQYLSVKADKSYFRISYEKEVDENEKMRFDLQLFNKAYDPINDPDAFLEIYDEDNNQYDYQFNRSSNAYFIELSGLDVGNYRFKAFANYDQKQLESSGRFSIREIRVENVQLVADHNLLFQLSEKSGGKQYNELDAEALLKELEQRTDIAAMSYATEDVEDIINLKWIFYLLIFLLALEWFIRKYQGAY